MRGRRLLAVRRQVALGLVLESSAPALVTAAFGRVHDLAVFWHIRGRARIPSELACPFGRLVHRPPQQVVNVPQSQIPAIKHRLEQLLYAVGFIRHSKQRNCIAPEKNLAHVWVDLPQDSLKSPPVWWYIRRIQP